MTRIHHPQNRADRLINEQKKAKRKKAKEEREGRVTARLAREQLRLQEIEDEQRLVGSSFSGEYSSLA